MVRDSKKLEDMNRRIAEARRRVAEQEARVAGLKHDGQSTEDAAKLLSEIKETLRLMQKHRDVLLELAHSNKSDLERALQRICSISAATLDVARVSYWSVLEDDSGISCEVLYLRNKDSFDQEFKGRRIVFAEYRAYFDELAARRTIVANEVLSHPATRELAENHLKPLGISSLLVLYRANNYTNAAPLFSGFFSVLGILGYAEPPTVNGKPPCPPWPPCDDSFGFGNLLCSNRPKNDFI